ncbi:MAG: DUF58 domain-containing protein [Bacteroidia bacterium]|jgi:uncharacterized protein (DUF58 family)|nr:DUF58 domain-containing protein [Bacteroidia bacterium]
MLINPSRQNSLSHLELLAKQVVEGFITGLHKSPLHGFSVEFAEHRLYNSGESTRHIDWKLYARSEKLFVKRYEEETNLRCQLVLDCSASMQFPKDQTNNKLRFSIEAAAALIELLKHQRDAPGLSTFADDLLKHIPAKGSPVQKKILMNELESLLNYESPAKQTSAALALNQLAEILHQRSMVIIFSDMFESAENSEELFSALQHLRYRKHEVVLFHVTDKAKELDFEFENKPHHFIDLESGLEVKLNPSQVREAYTKSLHQFNEALKLKCSQFKIDFIEADISKGFDLVLHTYLVKRSKMV